MAIQRAFTTPINLVIAVGYKSAPAIEFDQVTKG